MSNYKVRVNNEAESKEVQELFEQLGGLKYKNPTTEIRIGMVALEDGSIYVDYTSHYDDYDCEELTIPQLKDIVVLKRNDIGDATHIRGDGKKYFHAKSTDYYYQISNDGEWLLSTWMNYQLLPQLKPIEKKEMEEFLVVKEYLDPNNNYSYHKMPVVARGSNWVEVPHGENYAYMATRGAIVFMETRDEISSVRDSEIVWQRNKSEGVKEFLVNHDDKWTLQLLDSDTEENSYRLAVPDGAEAYVWFNDEKDGLEFYKDNFTKYHDNTKWRNATGLFGSHATILWQRHTQTEELPFIGDEPKTPWQKYKQDVINDLIDNGIYIDTTQDNVNHPAHYASGAVECIDAIEASMSEEAFRGYCKGNVQKYMWRYEEKGGKESLEKAQWYLNRLLGTF